MFLRTVVWICLCACTGLSNAVAVVVGSCICDLRESKSPSTSARNNCKRHFGRLRSEQATHFTTLSHRAIPPLLWCRAVVCSMILSDHCDSTICFRKKLCTLVEQAMAAQHVVERVALHFIHTYNCSLSEHLLLQILTLLLHACTNSSMVGCKPICLSYDEWQWSI